MNKNLYITTILCSLLASNIAFASDDDTYGSTDKYKSPLGIATTDVTREINDAGANLTITKTGKNGKSKTGTITTKNQQATYDDDGNKTGGSAAISTAKIAGTITIGNKQTAYDENGNKTGESADINISGKNGTSTGSISKATDGYIDNTAVRTSSSTEKTY